jgi:hypothetical protein
MPENWSFEDQKNVATISLKRIIERRIPILLVTHDAEDGTWQFLDGSDDLQPEDSCVVSLQSVVTLDPTVRELADLPPGWVAWRGNPNSPWQRAKQC